MKVSSVGEEGVSVGVDGMLAWVNRVEFRADDDTLVGAKPVASKASAPLLGPGTFCICFLVVLKLNFKLS